MLTFLLVPEAIMIEKKLVQVDGNLNDKKVMVAITQKHWLYQYANDLNDPATKNNVMKLLME